MEDKNKYRITDKQKELLKSFQCIRLKDYNCSNVYNFINERNKNISDTFNDDGLKEDKEREKAYYVIIRENKIALFFSIKCGSLFDAPISNIINNLIKNRNNILKRIILKINIDKIKEKNQNIKRVS